MTDMDMPLPEPAHTQVETYSGIALNKVVETPLFTADQLRAYGEAVRAEERERLLAVAAARTGHEAKAAAHHAGTWYEAYAHHLAAHKAMCDLIDAVWQDAAAIRSAAPPQCTAPPSEPQ